MFKKSKTNKLNQLFNEGVHTFVELPEDEFKLHFDYFIKKQSHKEIKDFIKLYKTFNKNYDEVFTKMFNIAIELRKTIK